MAIATAMFFPASTPAQTSLQRVASGLSNPLFVTAAPGDSSRFFVLEQGGGGTARIKTVNIGTGVVSTYLTISGIQTGGERGLLGLAFHPDFENNGHFYVNVTASSGFSNQTQIRRYTATGTPLTSTSASTTTLHPVLSFTQPFSNHNAGWIGFDPTSNDPYLYISSGDGGSGGDPGNRSQDITNQLLGKMLRVDVDGDDFASSSANYAIPPSNPFVGATGDDEIWSYGLRNHFRNSFDRQTGDLWIADVGQGAREEINWQPANSPGGENYGWRVMEGTRCFDNSQAGGNPPCFDGSLVDPVHEYGHSFSNSGGFSITGGYVYHGSVDRFQGQYFFADFVTENIWTIDPYAVDVSGSVQRRNPLLGVNVGSLSGISSFGEDDAGELYITGLNSGQIFRISSTSQDAEWNGDTSVGAAGDGSSWGNANNWSRGGNVDTGPVTQDTVIFLPGSSVSQINLPTIQTVAAAEFRGDYTLAGMDLQVLSGNVTVSSGVKATMTNDVRAETANQSLRKRGMGTLAINGNATQMVVLEGTLIGKGSIANLRVYDGGVVSAGEGIGALTVDENYQQRTGASLLAELGGTMAVSEYDQLQVVGMAELAGTLDIVDVNGFGPTTRGSVDNFTLITASEVTGTFDDASYNGDVMVALDGVNPDGSFTSHAGDGLFQTVSYSSSEVNLQNYYALPGDANGDGSVDEVDFNIWASNRFTNGTDWLTGDFDGDQDTDLADLHILNEFKFQSIDLVPEPGSLALALVAGLAMLALRRR